MIDAVNKTQLFYNLQFNNTWVLFIRYFIICVTIVNHCCSNTHIVVRCCLKSLSFVGFVVSYDLAIKV